MCSIIADNNIKNNLDQGIHNYILYLKMIKDVNIKLLSNSDNLVNTVGCSDKILDENFNIVNKNNEISYVVHQYDRFNIELRHKLNGKYGFNFL